MAAEQHKLSPENTTIKFVGSKKDGKHEGTFKKLDGTLAVDPADLGKANLAVTIDIASMTTDADKLTAHLKSPDFFDAKRYPQAKFVSKSIKAGSEKDTYAIDGELTMLGKTHPVSFPAKAVTADGKVTVTAQFDIKRSDWGMKYGMDKVNDAVQLSLEVKGPAK
jgi:polyisoprenoid-binding protein YceI